MVDQNPVAHEITPGSITRVLALGFSLVVVVLLIGGSIEFRSITSIQENAAKLVRQEYVARTLIESLQEEQKTLNLIFYKIAGDPDTPNAAAISQRLADVQGKLDGLEKKAESTDERAIWSELIQASHAFGLEANRLMADKDASELGSRDLFRRYEQVIYHISRLVREIFGKVAETDKEINNHAVGFDRESIVLISVSLLLALACSIVTARKTGRLFRNMNWQERELARVSWQMLQGQETIARRFSHELHDELGQTLAALKANMAAIPRLPGSAARLDDSTRLVDESIRNVRQLSQLLRPMILDDFGLDAGLNWLCEGFMQRTGIEVAYQSNYHSRLPDEMETHLFRIAQEALTNVARHSGAATVRMELYSDADDIRLTIADNGKGIQKVPANGQSLGMTGMRARARAVGGAFSVNSPEGKGVKIEVVVPMPESVEEVNEPHPNLAG
jgi:two-component system sensor histidine kinase UhpB